MKNKKHVFCAYQVYENDALKEYLENMALKGFRLTKIGQMFLTFEPCAPHPIRYCVEVMEKPSAYSSIQTPPLIQYREFCQDAGWDYVGTNGYLHVFYTENMDALPVETDAKERYEHICRACTGVYRTITVTFFILSILNLILCVFQGTLFCTNGFCVLLLMGTLFFFAGDYMLWKRRAGISLDTSGTLPSCSWSSVKTKNNLCIALIALLGIGCILSATDIHSPKMLFFLLLYLTGYCLILFFFSFLIRRLREKHSFSKTTNILIYWGCAILLILFAAFIVRGIIFL